MHICNKNVTVYIVSSEVTACNQFAVLCQVICTTCTANQYLRKLLVYAVLTNLFH